MVFPKGGNFYKLLSWKEKKKPRKYFSVELFREKESFHNKGSKKKNEPNDDN